MKPGNFRVVITGASSGIGAATAVAFARQGCALVLGARGKAGLEDIAARCRAAGGHAETRVVDVTDAAAVADFAAQARAVLGTIDLWFSDVGIGVLGKYTDVPVADHAHVINTNLVSHMNDAHAVLPIFLAQGHGIWVNMISLGGYIASPWAAAYTASKFGLRGFSAALRGELHDHPRIHICDVYPIFVATPALGHTGNYTGAKLAWPPGALAPETVADAVVQLARSPRATTAVGLPAAVLQAGGLANPIAAPMMSSFLASWSQRAEYSPDTTGTMYAPPATPSGIDGGTRPQGRQRNTALAVGAAMVAGVIGMRIVRGRT